MKMTTKRWKERIDRSLELQKERMEERKRFLRAYAGDYNEKPKKSLDGNKDEAVVNFVYAFVETVRPSLLPGTPQAFVEAEDPESEPQAPSYRAVINHFARVLGSKKEFKKVINDWFFSYAAVLNDWDYSEQLLYKEDGSPEIDPDSITEETPEGEQAFRIVKDVPILKRVDPKDVVLDPDSNSREEDRWRARRMVMTYAEFKALPGITPQMRKLVRPRMIPRELMRAGEHGNNSSEKNWVILWRIYDLENYCTKLMVDNEEVEDFLEDMEWPWEMDVGGDKFPLTILEGKWDDDNPYSFSSFRAYWGGIQDRNALRTIIKSTVRRNAPGWFMKKGAMDEEQKEKFTGSAIGELCEANRPEDIAIKPQFVLAPDFYNHDGQVADDNMNVSGLAEYQQTLQAETATQASIAESKSSIRKNEAKTDFNDFTAVVFGKLGQLCQQFLQEDKAIKIRTPKGPRDYEWLKVNGSMIQGNFHLTVKPDSDDASDRDLRRQQDMKTIEILGNNPHTDQRKLAVIAAEMLGREPEEILLPEAKVQENMRLQAELEANKGRKEPEAPKPLIDFSAIKVELLAPAVQAMIVAAALKQNAVPETLEGAELPPNAPDQGMSPVGPASPSLAPPAPEASIMPQGGMNQTLPPLPGAESPPATPVMPGSEFQGGSV